MKKSFLFLLCGVLNMWQSAHHALVVGPDTWDGQVDSGTMLTNLQDIGSPHCFHMGSIVKCYESRASA